MEEKKPKRSYVRKKPIKSTDLYAVKLQKSVDRPITSEREFEQRKQERVQINRKNKSRSKAQERDLAKRLSGDRTPMSGAGSSKGDVRVQFKNRPGHYMIEAKLSSRRLNYNGVSSPAIAISYLWFSKMIQDAKAMRSLFPILAVKYMNFRDQFIFIAVQDLAKIISTAPDATSVDWINKNKKSFQLFLPQLKDITAEYGIAYVVMPIGSYYVMTLEKWEELIADI